MEKPSAEMLAALNVRIAELAGIRFRRFRFWYSGHDGAKPFRNFDTREAAESDRRREVKWGCGEVEEFADSTRIPDFTGSLDAIHGALTTLLKGPARIHFSVVLAQLLGTFPFPAYEQACFAFAAADATTLCIALDRTLSKEPIL